MAARDKAFCPPPHLRFLHSEHSPEQTCPCTDLLERKRERRGGGMGTEVGEEGRKGGRREGKKGGYSGGKKRDWNGESKI